MTTAIATTMHKRERRTVKPFDAPTAIEQALKGTRMVINEQSLEDGDVECLEPGQGGTPSLHLELDASAVAGLTADWSLNADDLAVVVLVEARMLNLLDLIEVPVEWANMPSGNFRVGVELPGWIQEAMGRTRLGVRAYLVIAKERAAAGPSQATAKGSVLASWTVTIDVPEVTHWFTPKLLTPQVREDLEKSCSTNLSGSTLMFVRVENLLQPGTLAEAVRVYLDPEIAGLLDNSRPGSAVKMLESRIIYDVLLRIFEGIRQELEESSPADLGELAALPFLKLLAEQLDIEPTVVVERMQGSPTELEAMRTHLQKVAAILGTSKSAIKGDTE